MTKIFATFENMPADPGAAAAELGLEYSPAALRPTNHARQRCYIFHLPSDPVAVSAFLAKLPSLGQLVHLEEIEVSDPPAAPGVEDDARSGGLVLEKFSTPDDSGAVATIAGPGGAREPAAGLAETGGAGSLAETAGSRRRRPATSAGKSASRSKSKRRAKR